MPQLTQITRHDCVEGWSVIGKWSGVALADVLATWRPQPDARYVVFRCFDKDEAGAPYYESLDLHEAAHPQTLLALDSTTSRSTPITAPRCACASRRNSATRARSGFAVSSSPHSFDHHRRGKGGYWEDQGYEWYAGI